MRSSIATVILLGGCVVSPDLSHLGQPCAAGYGWNGTSCIAGFDGGAPRDTGGRAGDAASLDTGRDSAVVVPDGGDVDAGDDAGQDAGLDAWWSPDRTGCLLHVSFDGDPPYLDDCDTNDLDVVAGSFSPSAVPHAGEFDGSNCLMATDSPTFTVGSAVSIAFWARTNQDTAGFVTKRVQFGSDLEYGLLSVGHALQLDLDNTRTDTMSAIAPSGWHHYALTYDGAATPAALAYLDGVMVGSAAGPASLPDGTGILAIGCQPYGSTTMLGDFLVGYMDEVYVWNRWLSASEVSDLFTHGRP